jgi:hypothetical protein
MGSSLFGYAVASELPLERLTDAPAPRGRLSVVSASRPLLDDEGELLAWMEADQPARWLALARSPAGLVGACSETGAFLVEPEHRRVHAEPLDGTGEAWQHRMVATAIPLLLAGLGDLVLHAAAVSVSGKAVVFCGASGRGKSTLALRLADAGFPVMGEDGVSISFDGGRPVAWPGPDGVRLADGAGAPKRTRPLPAKQRARDAAPVVAAVALAPRTPGDLVVERLDPVTGARAIVSSTMYAPGAGFAHAFSLTARLVEAVPVFRARLPADLARADVAARALIARVAA